MEISRETVNGVDVIRFSGRLNTTSAPDAEKEITTIIEENPEALLVNLAEVDYISSAGLRVLLLGAKMMGKGKGALGLCCLQNAVKEVFDISGFTAIFRIFDSEDAAIKEITTA